MIKEKFVERNPVTGDKLMTKPPTSKYAEGWDRIFGAKKEKQPEKKQVTTK